MYIPLSNIIELIHDYRHALTIIIMICLVQAQSICVHTLGTLLLLFHKLIHRIFIIMKN